MSQAQQPEALRLAAICESKGMFSVADELNCMHARLLELEQGKCLHQIAEPAAALTEQDATLLNQGIELLFAISNDERNSGNCSAAEGAAASAYAVQRLTSTLLTTQRAAPQAVQAATESVLIDGVAYDVHAEVAAELLRLHIELQQAPAHPAEGVPAPVEVWESEALRDSAWYWVERETWGNEASIAPAMYKENCDAWYSYQFGGIPTRHLKVLAPCLMQSRDVLAATQPAAQGMQPAVPEHGEVLVTVSGFTGSGKSAIAGEIEIMCRALGLQVEWPDGVTEKNMTHADWTTALELHNPRVRIVERNVPRNTASGADQ